MVSLDCFIYQHRENTIFVVHQSQKSINIGIVGLGLIGGSLSLDLKRLGYQIYGLTHRLETAEKAKQRSLAHVISTDPIVLRNCGIIIIALPIKQLLNPSSKLLEAIPKDAVVTDVGSVKVPVLETWRHLHPRFVASHPMAGTNESGVEAGKENLFKGKPWVTTPEQKTDKKALEVVHKLASSLGSKWITTEADLHDQAVALISHLPVFISTALLKTVKNEKSNSIFQLTKDLASSGFMDTTRIGGGNSELGVSMAKNNKLNILKTIDSYKKALNVLEEGIIAENWEMLKNELENTKQVRTEFTKNSNSSS